jgi:signal transduction histidine kinase
MNADQRQSSSVIATADEELNQLESQQLAQLEDQRRYNLLRILVPVIFVLSVLSLPGAIFTDVNGPNGVAGIYSLRGSTFQVLVLLIGMVIASLALRRRNVNISSLALFSGVSILILLLLLDDTVFSMEVKLGIIPEFALLLVPIVLASVLGGRLSVILTTVGTTTFTFALLTFVPHDQSFIAFQEANAGGFVLYTVPIGLQAVTGALIFGSIAGLRRAQVQLSTVRVAYERERELDELKNQFITSINHELRTPLMASQGYLTLAREFSHAGEIDQEERMFVLGLESIQHINALVESILDVRRLDTDVTSLQISDVDLYGSVISATNLIDPHMIQGERAIHLNVSRDLKVQADEGRLRQVLINLISNACKYSQPDTPIHISAQAVNSSQRTQRSAKSPMLVQITVKDAGLGIPPDQIPLLFQRFVRLKRDIASNVTGTGLGLAISRAFVEAMGGSIWVESTGVPGEGAAFSFTLPQANASSHQAAD